MGRKKIRLSLVPKSDKDPVDVFERFREEAKKIEEEIFNESSIDEPTTEETEEKIDKEAENRIAQKVEKALEENEEDSISENPGSSINPNDSSEERRKRLKDWLNFGAQMLVRIIIEIFTKI